MSFKSALLSAGLSLGMAFPLFAGDIMVMDAYARTAMKGGKSGAAFMQIMNHGEADDRLVSASSDIAKKVELHTHKDMGDGVMKMMEVEEGFAIPAGETYALKRGGDHVMFMGLNQDMVHGEKVSVTLSFEKAGDMIVEIPVDLERQDHGGHGGHDGHGGHGGHGNMDHSNHGTDG